MGNRYLRKLLVVGAYAVHLMSGRVRRETGKRQTVEVRHGEGVANRTGPE